MRTIAVRGVKLNVLDVGAGPVILFVHGFPLDHSMWEGQIDGLSDAFRFVVPDLRGFGQSETTEGTVSMEQFADDLDGLLDAIAIREPVTFCGLSMGGYIAWQFYRKYRARLRALILCDTRAAADTPDAARDRLRLAHETLERGASVVAEPMKSKLFSDTTLSNHPELLDRTHAIMLGTEPIGIAAALRGMAERPDSRDLLPQIDVPSLVLVGTDDRISTVDEMRAMSSIIPNARFVEIPDAGHMAPLENPELVNAAIRSFLATVK